MCFVCEGDIRDQICLKQDIIGEYKHFAKLRGVGCVFAKLCVTIDDIVRLGIQRFIRTKDRISRRFFTVDLAKHSIIARAVAFTIINAFDLQFHIMNVELFLAVFFTCQNGACVFGRRTDGTLANRNISRSSDKR